MRDRHIPRLCGKCQAPTSRQEDSCWRCGAQWASEEVPPTTLRVIAGGRLEHGDDDRWVNEGGRFAAEATAAVSAMR
jgi:hypothetical protein